MPCHSFDLSPTIDLDSARMFSLVIFEDISLTTKTYGLLQLIITSTKEVLFL